MASIMSRASGSLYDIVFEVRNNLGSGLPKSSGGESAESAVSFVRQFRSIILTDTSSRGSFSFSFGDIVLLANDGSESSTIDLSASTPDSLVGMSESKPFTVRTESNASVDIVLNTREWKLGGKIVLEQVEQVSGRVVKTLDEIQVSEAADVRQRRVRALAPNVRPCVLLSRIADVDPKMAIERQINILKIDAETRLPKGPGLPDSKETSFLPERTVLLQNYPNPFNSETRVEYWLKEPAAVDLKAFDMLGREIGILTRGYRDAGFHSVVWNAENLAAGFYLVRLSVSSNAMPTYSATKIVLLIE